MPLTRLRDSLADRGNPVSLATLSYWRSGTRQPDPVLRKEVIADIEEILALEEGDLVRLAVKPRDVGQVPPAARHLPTLEHGGDRIQSVLDAKQALNGPADDTFRMLSVQMTTDVGAEGLPIAATCQFLLQCVKGTLTHHVLCVAPAGEIERPMVIDVVGGGAVVDQYLSPQCTVQAVSIELDRTLEVGESLMLEIRVDMVPEGSSGNPFGQFMTVPAYHLAHKVANWIRFDPRRIPDWFEEVDVTPDGEQRRARVLDTPTSIHQVRWNFGPGSVTLHWGYGEPPGHE